MGRSVRTSAAPKLTRAALDAVPESMIGEIIDDRLYVHPRPRPAHQDAVTDLGMQIRAPFGHGRGGPGGWHVLVEPGIELPDAPEIVPDVAGWRRERLPVLPIDAPITVAPDWVCEILSPSTTRHDLLVKRPFYARAGVLWLWLLSPLWRSLTVSKLVDGKWVEEQVFADGGRVRAEPFAAIELDLEALFPPLELVAREPTTLEPPKKKSAKKKSSRKR